jgi:hypothetical protein
VGKGGGHINIKNTQYGAQEKRAELVDDRWATGAETAATTQKLAVCYVHGSGKVKVSGVVIGRNRDPPANRKAAFSYV